MSRGIAILTSSIAVLCVLAAIASPAEACEGKCEPTTLSTKLSEAKEGKESEELTVLEGAKVKDKAKLSGKNAAKATGKVIYRVYSEKECKTLVTVAGEVTVSGESVPASTEKEFEGGKTYFWQAHYGGDSNNGESTSPCTEVLKVKARTSLTTELSGGGEEGDEITVYEGAKAKDKATLSGTNSSSAGGKAVYKVYSESGCKTLVTEAGEVTVSSGVVPASSEEELKAGAAYYWQATYKGDSLHQESTSSCNAVLNVVTCSTYPYCEPTITPGVEVTNTVGTTTKACTAGPIMKSGTELFLLTAGHCIGSSTGTETITRKVESAYPSAPATKKSIGEKVTFNFTDNYDIAEVKIENASWLLPGGGAPPLVVEWETTPKLASVVGEAASLPREEVCMTGARSRLQCGEVLQTGVTKEGVKNLVETSIKAVQGDSGAPVLVRIEGGDVQVQGVLVTGEGEDVIKEPATTTNGSDQITGFPNGKEACEIIAEMKTKWVPGPAVEGSGIPAGTKVTECKEVGATATIKMSAAATLTGVRTITIGYRNLSSYEPMSQIKAVFTGQTLLEA